MKPNRNLLKIISIKKSDEYLQSLMAIHYSQPKGFVGRQLHYKIYYNNILYGCICFGSVCLNFPNRPKKENLNEGISNIFFHVEKYNNKYPCRNFTTFVLLEAERHVCVDYKLTYNNDVTWIETFVEPPRSGDLYIKAGYSQIGITKGFTCKRIGGESTDSYGGKRVWDYKNLRPKLAFYKELKIIPL